MLKPLLLTFILVTSAAEDLVITKGPYIQNVSPTSIVIMWETNIPSTSRVEYTVAPHDPLTIEDTCKVEIHEIKLKGLRPNTVYTYRVASDAIQSSAYTFRTAPQSPRSFRFVAYGDSRSNPDDHQDVISAIIESQPTLVLHTGDLVGYGDWRSEWGTDVFEPAHTLMTHVPIFPVMGNHEYWTNGRSWFSSYFALPHNEQWFAFSYGNVRFIGLDTNVSFLPNSVQMRWLAAELHSQAYRKATWHIVYLHHPPFTATNYDDDRDIIQHLVPLFEQGQVDMVFAGHAHCYERYRHHGIHYIVTGGGGTHLGFLEEDTQPPLRLVGKSVHHHCVVDVNVPDSSLVLSVLRNNHTEIDKLRLTRPKPPVAH